MWKSLGGKEALGCLAGLCSDVGNLASWSCPRGLLSVWVPILSLQGGQDAWLVMFVLRAEVVTMRALCLPPWHLDTGVLYMYPSAPLSQLLHPNLFFLEEEATSTALCRGRTWIPYYKEVKEHLLEVRVHIIAMQQSRESIWSDTMCFPWAKSAFRGGSMEKVSQRYTGLPANQAERWGGGA